MRVVLIIVIFLSSFLCVHGQVVGYSYDASGNRIERKLINMTTKSGAVATEDEDELADILCDIEYSIYPNPTTGILKVKITNKPVDEAIMVGLYRIDGTLIHERAHTTEIEQIDISTQLQGVYLLVITIGEERSTWKVIKQ